ncbi:hypothetical protein V8C35DRAFT_330759 [Trichoderma chlorosporum]
MELDLNSTWIDLCEYKEVRTIKHASVVEDVWTLLIKEADSKHLLISSRNIGHGQGPAYKIARWIPILAKKYSLSLEQSFKKSEITAEDVIFCLDTVWTMAKYIPCRPSIQLAFHCTTLLGSIRLGQWYFITIHHVKQKKNRIQRDQRSRLQFPMTLVPHKLLYLVTLFTIRAIADNAFKVGYRSCDQVLRPGPLEKGVNYIRLKWSDEVLKEKKKIVPLSYRHFVGVWNRVYFVAGSREKKRPYALRVGAGGRLNGSLTTAVRNYILLNSTDLFKRSYQLVQIRDRLPEIAFGKLGKQDDALWSVISNAFLRRDPYAPLYITQAEIDEINERNDIKTLRQELPAICNKQGPRSKEEGKIWGRISWIYDCLEKDRLLEKRQAYFAEVDSLRAQGKLTGHLYNLQATNPRRVFFQASNAAAEEIASLLIDKMPPKTLLDKIVTFLRGQAQQGDENVDPVAEDLKPRPFKKSRCLLGCGEYFNRASLTRHVKQAHDFRNPFHCPECRNLGLGEYVFTERGFLQHVNKKHSRDFSRPFQCPECQRQEQIEKCLISGRDSWVAHVREIHNGGGLSGAILDWKAEGSLDPHADEEFWVEGRD